MAPFLAHGFADPSLLELALTHRSARGANNERLEFLGDALLGQIVAVHLYERFPDADEGQLTRTRATLVKRETLARIARSLDLGEHIILGEGELKSGGWRRDSILANTVEALIGAVYLDGGFHACVEQTLSWFSGELENADPSAASKDAKTRLQEFLQARGKALPQYTSLNIVGPAHDQQFTIECSVEALAPAVQGTAKSRRAGEQTAAALMLAQLEDNSNE